MVDTENDLALMSLLTGKLVANVGQALSNITIEPTDTGVAGLIVLYADQIDKGNLATLAKLGPLLLNAMESLGMSPKSRSTALKGKLNEPAVRNAKDDLRDRRNSRADRASHSHPAS